MNVSTRSLAKRIGFDLKFDGKLYFVKAVAFDAKRATVTLRPTGHRGGTVTVEVTNADLARKQWHMLSGGYSN